MSPTKSIAFKSIPVEVASYRVLVKFLRTRLRDSDETDEVLPRSVLKALQHTQPARRAIGSRLARARAHENDRRFPARGGAEEEPLSTPPASKRLSDGLIARELK